MKNLSEPDWRKIQRIRTLRSTLLQNGFKPIPIYGADQEWADVKDKNGKKNGKTNAGKIPVGDEWQVTARNLSGNSWNNKIDIRKAPNTGILADGLRVIDVDTDNPDEADAILGLINYFLHPIVTMRVRQGATRFLTIFRAEDGTSPSKSKDKRKSDNAAVEILGNGNQFIVDGIHCKLRAIDGTDDYERIYTDIQWHPVPITEIKWIDIPVVTEQQVTDFRKAVRTVLAIPEPIIKVYNPNPNITITDPTDADLEAIVDVLTPAMADDYDIWLYVVSALSNVTNKSGIGRHLAHEFSKKAGTEYDCSGTNSKFNHPTIHDFSYLIGMARQADPDFVTPSYRSTWESEHNRIMADNISAMKRNNSTTRENDDEDFVMDLDF